MQTESIERWSHDHTFGQDDKRSAERRTLAVSVVTVLTMIVEVLAGKYLGARWLDPFMGLVGGALVTRRSRGVLRSSTRVLLDMQAPEKVGEAIRRAIESVGDNRVSDLHVRSVGPGIHAAEIAVVSSRPLDPDNYYRLLPRDLGPVHVTFEIPLCAAHGREFASTAAGETTGAKEP